MVLLLYLGTVGRNVGAGMTGGVGYFYDPSNDLEERLNKEIVQMQRVESSEGEAQLKHIIERHFEKTGKYPKVSYFASCQNSVFV